MSHFIEEIRNQIQSRVNVLSDKIGTTNLTQSDLDTLELDIYSYVIGTQLVKMAFESEMIECIENDDDGYAILKVEKIEGSEMFQVECLELNLENTHKGKKEKTKKQKNREIEQTVLQASESEQTPPDGEFISGLISFLQSKNK